MKEADYYEASYEAELNFYSMQQQIQTQNCSNKTYLKLKKSAYRLVGRKTTYIQA